MNHKTEDKFSFYRPLSHKKFNVEPCSSGYVDVGVVRQLAIQTLIYFNADKDDSGYCPHITVFSHGKQVKPMNDSCCFDLIKQIGVIICVRGMRYDDDGRPLSFLVETYKPQPALVLVN